MLWHCNQWLYHKINFATSLKRTWEAPTAGFGTLTLNSVHLQSFSCTRSLLSPASLASQQSQCQGCSRMQISTWVSRGTSNLWAVHCLALLTMQPAPCPTPSWRPHHTSLGITHHQPNITMQLILPGLKPGHGEGAVLTQVTANNFTHFDILAKCSPVNRKKHAAVLSLLIKESENKFQDEQKIIHFFVYLGLNFQLT